MWNPLKIKERPGDEAPPEVYGWRPYALAFSASWVSNTNSLTTHKVLPTARITFTTHENLLTPQHKLQSTLPIHDDELIYDNEPPPSLPHPPGRTALRTHNDESLPNPSLLPRTIYTLHSFRRTTLTFPSQWHFLLNDTSYSITSYLITLPTLSNSILNQIPSSMTLPTQSHTKPTSIHQTNV